MRSVFFLRYAPALLILMCCNAASQSSFDPEAYLQYIQENQDMSADALLSKHPPRTTYYSSRANPVDPAKVPWFDSINRVFNLTDHEQALLGQHFFMVTERLSSYSWLDNLVRTYNHDLPLFLSTDFILFTLHNSYDKMLQTLEWQLLETNLASLLEAMYERYPEIYKEYNGDARFEAALADVDNYIAVARSLLHAEEYLPRKHNSDKYREIMDGVASGQMKSMSLFTMESRTRKIDFSQFKPRGHYTEEFWTPGGKRTLEDYFRAMMWLGRIDFLLTPPPENPWEDPWTDDEILRMQLGALLLNEVLYTSGRAENLVLHERIISYLVGPDDNLTPVELRGLSSRLLPTPDHLFSTGVFDAFMDSLNASDDHGQKIMSNFFLVDPWSEDPGKLPVSFKLTGQKFLIDSYIFSEVVFDRIVHQGAKVWRALPDPLDAMAVLGNEDALALLENELKEYKYAYKLDALRTLVEAYDPGFWDQSLYNSWLNAIRALNPPASSTRLPYFMQTTAWHHEKLNTQLTSWAELRHDNILYGKQSYTGGTACSYPFTYVEPYPEFYALIAAFAEDAGSFFREINQDHSFEACSAIIRYYEQYASIIRNLEEIARKELAGTALSGSEIIFLKTMINSYMASGPSVTGWVSDLFFDQAAGMSPDLVVADVHTQPTDQGGAVVGNVLHVGNGRINRGVFIAPNPTNPDQLMAFTGPVASFHYEVTSGFNRLTDEDWDARFREGNPPPRPDWTACYLAGPDGRVADTGRRLKGEVYTGTFVDPAEAIRDLDYLLLFPNPAGRELNLRFVLNRSLGISCRIFDASGRLVQHERMPLLPADEHNVPMDLTGWGKGIYLLKFDAGNTSLTRKLVVQ